MNHPQDDPIDRITLAKSHSTSSKLLEQLSKICTKFETHRSPGSYFTLSVAIASNPNTPVHVLKELYRQAEVIVDAPPGTMDYSISDWNNIEILRSTIKRNPSWQKAYPNK